MASALDRFRLDGQVAVITGGARGIGRATAEAFIAAGARAVLVDGVVVYRDGTFSRCADVGEVVAAAERSGRAILDQAGLSHLAVGTFSIKRE